MNKCYMVDYHAKDIGEQILWIVKDADTAELIEITVRYGIDVLKICYGRSYNKINVMLTKTNGYLILNFKYLTATNKTSLKKVIMRIK